jgi:hypothetical protein
MTGRSRKLILGREFAGMAKAGPPVMKGRAAALPFVFHREAKQWIQSASY